MPDRPGVDDNAELQRLIALWADTGADLNSQLAEVRDEIETLVRSGLNPTRRRRLGILAERLTELRDAALSMVDALNQSTAAWLGEPNLGLIYSAGAAKVPGFVWSGAHQAAVDIIAQDLMGQVLAKTAYVEQSAKEWAARESRRILGYKTTQGVPADTAARQFIRRLRAEFTARGMVGVRYRNGARHSFMEYGEMLIRTHSARAYNIGTLNAGRQARVQYFELLDGALCGLAGHNLPPLANGLIVDLRTALDWPLAHPNCRRSINPRPDLDASNVSTAVSVQSPEAASDQSAFERALAEETATRRRRRFRG